MSVIAALLLAVAIADLVGGQIRQVGAHRPWAPTLAGGAVLLLVGIGAGWGSAAGVSLLVVAAAVVLGWQITAARAFSTDTHHWLPLGVLAGGVALLIGLSGFSPAVGGHLEQWLRWSQLPVTDSVDAERLLLIVGLLAVQVSTANVVVRLVLRHVGAMKPSGPQPSDKLRGGRLLGPMERVVIVGLGLAGQLTAASLVIAAKGLIRWPELQKARAAIDLPDAPRRDNEVTIDEVTEYFLVGSFVSWVFALGAVAAAALL